MVIHPLYFVYITDLVKAVNPFLDRIPSELQEEYLRDFLGEAKSIDMIGVDGTVNMEYRLLVTFAKKPLELST